MRQLKIVLTTAVLSLILFFSSCDIARSPYDGIPVDQALSSVQGIEDVTRGNYAYLKDETRSTYGLVMMLYQPGDYRSDDLMISGTTSNRMMLTYNYLHNPNMPNTSNMWRRGYRLIYNANTVIEAITPGESPDLDQLRGENQFLRSLMTLHLVTAFGRPYSHGRDNLGVPIMREPDLEAQPARATVGEVYDFLVQDLTEAANLMGSEKSSAFGTKEAALALLSRVYLYMEENQNAISAADQVISSGRYELVDGETLPNYFTFSPVADARSESIFAIRHVMPADDHGRSHGVGSMIYRSPSGSGWGENYASKTYRDLINKWPSDVRRQFVEPQYQIVNGDTLRRDDGLYQYVERNGFPRFYVTKFCCQEGTEMGNSPELIRYSEVYLNKAEALAKLGQDQAALDIVNMLRERAQIPQAGMYSLSNLGDHDTVLDVVLEERRLELFMEGHRAHDLFRNKRDLFRDYPGTHLAPGNPGVDLSRGPVDPYTGIQGIQHIPWDHNRIIFQIPEEEIALNPNLQQNPI
ncbi:RagB/SusD family nutrient uptake outer membrane protein [Rhodohalobacter sulfatireducens]|uniref:RagB/SusD family nutrient uptake outer membrane protein n=1 Tax=Rhodohalobacter sulfatireducens TaxID=2911366 RepID=A0ABS9K9D7_9BACT|nr:RagB/SusD family nutrient uptake outer membrane protein [Rhodohalobacter sulfatireducens]MCG2587474.1 RagB/SusD family nutrient uptake outer membrane protein [Rhodohalobacter sulfatireducens]